MTMHTCAISSCPSVCVWEDKNESIVYVFAFALAGSLSLKILSGARSCLALMESPSFQRRKEGFMLHASTSLCPAPVVGSSGAGREDPCSSFLVRRQYLAHTYFTSQHGPASTLYCYRFIYLLSLVSIGIWSQQVSFMQ